MSHVYIYIYIYMGASGKVLTEKSMKGTQSTEAEAAPSALQASAPPSQEGSGAAHRGSETRTARQGKPRNCCTRTSACGGCRRTCRRSGSRQCGSEPSCGTINNLRTTTLPLPLPLLRKHSRHANTHPRGDSGTPTPAEKNHRRSLL